MFSTEVRILACPSCGAPLQLPRQGGQIQCGYCRASLTVAGRDDTPLQTAGASLLSEPERMQGLWAQASTFGMKPLPPEMRAALAGGPLTAARVGAALGLWRVYCQRAAAGDAAAGDLAVLMVGSIASYFSSVARDPARQRALSETTLEALRDSSQRQVIRCQLARLALRGGDLASARSWFGACDPRAAELQADTAYRLTYAHLTTAARAFDDVLVALGPTPSSVPVALPSRLPAAVLRANALERTGDVPGAVEQLTAEARAVPGGGHAMLGVVDANEHLQLCPQSLALARARW